MDYESDFICHCGNLLYVDGKTKKEFCLNSSCFNGIKEKIKEDTRPADEDLKKIHTKSIIELRQFSRDFLFSHLTAKREEQIKDYFFMRRTNIDQFYAINELIRMVNRMNFQGRNTSVQKVNEFIERFTRYVTDKNFLDDILIKRYVLTDNYVLRLKYSKVFMELLANYGIIAKEKISAESTFKYVKIDFQNDFPVQYKPGDDLSVYFKRFYRLMLTIDYFLNYHYSQSQTYSYLFTNRDIAFLLSFWYSVKSEITELSFENMRKHLTLNYSDANTHSSFLNNLVLCSDQVPIFIKKSNGYVMGMFSILYFTFYLMGLYSKETIQEGKGIASLAFENEIRDRLKNKKIMVPFDKEFKLSKKSPYSYDIIAISQDKREIYLIEAKYKDIPSSSINGVNLIQNELYSEEGLINVSSKQKERVKYFKENLSSFNRFLKLGKVEEFSIKGYIVTKFRPLISRKEEIILCDMEQLLILI